MPYFFTILLYGIFTLLFVGQCIYIINGGVKMFEISKYKKSYVKLSIRLPENMNELLRNIAKKENMSFNNVIVSCIQTL